MGDIRDSMVNNQPNQIIGEECPLSSHLLSAVLKKTSPLKHVTPIIKKYDCQRQAKNGKSLKLKCPGKSLDEDSNLLNPPKVLDLGAGMDSLDAALRRAERCIAGNKQPDIHPGDASDHVTEANGDDLGDGEEEPVSSSTVASSHQNVGSNRAVHPRIRNRVLKKRNQLQKDLEHALPLATSDQPLLSEEQSHGFAAQFFLRVKERYETQDNSVFAKFLELMEEFGKSFSSVTDLYHRVIRLLEGDPELCEDFLLFLLPKQALRCGKFMEHLALTEMSSFLRKLELSFTKQPQHLRKIHATWARLAETPNLTLEAVRSAILPLLRGNTVLVDSFLELLPSERPPESKMTDFDQVVCEDMDSEHSGEEDTFERIDIPPEHDDLYGGENCQCCCHDGSVDSAYLNRTKHCVPCGIKFISGKIFMQTEHGLRPVRIEFSGNDSTSNNIKRLNAHHQKLSRPRSRRGRTGTSQASVKTDDCKQSVETDDEAAFPTKFKSPRQRPKITKPNREKPSSARSLSMNRAVCPRKPIVGNASSPPLSVIHDQQAVPTPSPCKDYKPPTLDFSNLSVVLHRYQNGNERDDPFVKSESRTGMKLMIENQVQKPEIKEECGMIDGATGTYDIINVNCTDSNMEKKETNLQDDIKSDDDASDDVSIDEIGKRVEDSVEDAEIKSNVDISGASSDCDMEETSDNKEGSTWTREEDRIILCTFQSEPDREKTLHKICSQIPHRTIDEISSRFQVLMNLIQQMR